MGTFDKVPSTGGKSYYNKQERDWWQQANFPHKQNLNLLGAPDLQLIFNQFLFKDGFYKQAASGLGFTFGEYT
jgi:hypothetical protein